MLLITPLVRYLRFSARSIGDVGVRLAPFSPEVNHVIPSEPCSRIVPNMQVLHTLPLLKA